MYICPVCRKRLEKACKSYKCENGHCFDIARGGYVNLLTTAKHNPKTTGDNPAMVKARTDFLDKNYYLPLAKRVGELLNNISQEIKADGMVNIIDSGCGEGFYSTIYAKCCENAHIYGIDISKTAVAHCGTRKKISGIENVDYAVASSFDLPFADKSADIIVSTFAPVTNDEYARILKKDGKLVVVSPSARHLFGLKEVLYDVPYENMPNKYNLTDFTLTNEEIFEYDITLESNADILNLFTMTPYYYKTSSEAKQRLDTIHKLDTLCGFSICTFTKNN